MSDISCLYWRCPVPGELVNLALNGMSLFNDIALQYDRLKSNLLGWMHGCVQCCRLNKPEMMCNDPNDTYLEMHGEISRDSGSPTLCYSNSPLHFLHGTALLWRRWHCSHILPIPQKYCAYDFITRADDNVMPVPMRLMTIGRRLTAQNLNMPLLNIPVHIRQLNSW